jgi:hypothetical protein
MTGRFASLNQIAPDKIEDVPAVDVAKIDAAAGRHGFTSREPSGRLYKMEMSKEATVPLSIRPPLSVANRFVAWCKENRLSYWEGLNELMKHKGI